MTISILEYAHVYKHTLEVFILIYQGILNTHRT